MQFLTKTNGRNYTNGKWITHNDQLTVSNPYNNEVVGTVPLLTTNEISDTIDAAYKAFDDWKSQTSEYRAECLMRWHALILKHLDELALLLTTEQGKAISDAKSEIAYGASFIKWSAEYANKTLGSYGEGNSNNQNIIIEYEPIGVVGAITPWNFPSAMITRKVSPALATGCTVVLKPSELTPFSALALAVLAEEARIPPGVFNVITADAEMVGDVFTQSRLIKKISFTGSTRVGRILYNKASNNMQKLALELGGNAPFIICEDCDIERTTTELIAAKIRSGGQACTSPNRIFIHTKIYDQVITSLYNKLKKIKAGDGRTAGIELGPLINQQAVDKITALIDDATTHGANLMLGGKVASGTIFPATLISNCTDDMEIFTAEIFGPVFACYEFDSIDEVIKHSNNTDYGLASYVYTSNLHTALKLKQKLNFAMVAVNTPIISQYKGAFGGRNNSGFGIEGSHLGLYEFMIPKYTLLEF